MAKCGIIFGSILLILFAIFCSFTLKFLCISAKKLKAVTYTELVDKLMGKIFRYAFSLFLFSVLLSIMIGFLVLIRSISQNIFKYIFSSSSISQSILLVICVLLSFPFMLVENLNALRYSCYFGFFSVICLIVCLIYYILVTEKFEILHLFLKLKLFPATYSDILKSIPIVALLYLNHFNVFGVLSQLKSPSDHRVNILIVSANSIITIIFIFLGIIGCSIFQIFPNSPIEDNILNAVPSDDPILALGRIFLLVALICNLPIMMLPSRSIITDLLWVLCQKYILSEEDNETIINKVSLTPLVMDSNFFDTPPRSLIEKKNSNKTWGGDFIVNKEIKKCPSNGELVNETEMPSESDLENLLGGEVSHDYRYKVGSKPNPNIFYQLGEFELGFGGQEANWKEWGKISSGFSSNELNENVSRRSGDMNFFVDLYGGKINDQETIFKKAADSNKRKFSLDLMSPESKEESTPLLEKSYRTDKRKWIKYTIRVFSTISILIFITLLSMNLPDQVSKVWEISGGSIGLLISLIIPSFLYIRLRQVLKAQIDIFFIISIIIFVFVTPIMFICTVNFIFKSIVP